MTSSPPTRTRPPRIATWLASLALLLSTIIPADGLALCIDRDHFAVGLLDRSGAGVAGHGGGASKIAATSEHSDFNHRGCPCGGGGIAHRAKHTVENRPNSDADRGRGTDHRDIAIDTTDARCDGEAASLVDDGTTSVDLLPPTRIIARRPEHGARTQLRRKPCDDRESIGLRRHLQQRASVLLLV